MSAALSLEVFLSPTRQIGEADSGRTFSPITSTLIYGENDAVLVDAQFIEEDVEALAAFVERVDRRLTTIFITHGHGDHWYGADFLTARHPGARVVTTASIANYIEIHRTDEVALYRSMFGDRVFVSASAPAALAGNAIALEGHALRVIEVGQGDIAPSAVLHVPSLRAVVAGDVVYNGIHQMLAFGGPDEWRRWIESVDKIEALAPEIVVAGHKRAGRRDDDPRVFLEETRQYIRDFAELAGTVPSSDALIAAMRERYPEHGNVTTLVYSAKAAMPGR